MEENKKKEENKAALFVELVKAKTFLDDYKEGLAATTEEPGISTLTKEIERLTAKFTELGALFPACPICGGLGYELSPKGKKLYCKPCQTTGKKNPAPCSACDGEGLVPDPDDVLFNEEREMCPVCNGYGAIGVKREEASTEKKEETPTGVCASCDTTFPIRDLHPYQDHRLYCSATCAEDDTGDNLLAQLAAEKPQKNSLSIEINGRDPKEALEALDGHFAEVRAALVKMLGYVEPTKEPVREVPPSSLEGDPSKPYHGPAFNPLAAIKEAKEDLREGRLPVLDLGETLYPTNDKQVPQPAAEKEAAIGQAMALATRGIAPVLGYPMGEGVMVDENTVKQWRLDLERARDLLQFVLEMKGGKDKDKTGANTWLAMGRIKEVLASLPQKTEEGGSDA